MDSQDQEIKRLEGELAAASYFISQILLLLAPERVDTFHHFIHNSSAVGATLPHKEGSRSFSERLIHNLDD